MPKLPVDTSIVLEVGPLLARTDGFTYEDSIAYNETNMSVTLFIKTTTSLTATAITLTSGGANDWTFKAKGTYEVEITDAQNNTEGVIWLEGICDGVLPFFSAKYDAVPANVFNSLILGTDLLDISLAQWIGVAPLALSSQKVQAHVVTKANIDFGALEKTSLNASTPASIQGNIGGNVSGTINGFTTAAKAELESEANDALVAEDLDHLVKTTIAAGKPAVGTLLDKIMNKGGSQTHDPTTDSQEALKDSVATASEVADAVHDEVIEGTLTSRQLMRIFLSVLAGLTTGGGTVTVNFRDLADSKNRIIVTVDVNGNRTAITLDGT